jgi:lipopolysaccharide/colanic/teichoic acid biosynthesis glycosyltransferase
MRMPDMSNLIARIIALALLVILSPFLLVLALGVALSMGFPVLFRQQRAGRDGRTFEMIKLRSMRNATNADGVPLPDHVRVTTFGRFLRRTRLDELPGLFNILAGDIAFVGPRPLLPETIRNLGPCGIARGAVRPGLTGWSQVNGNTRLSLDRKIDLDLWYVENRTWLLDAQILVRTFSVMIFGEKDTSVTRPADGAKDHM